MLVLITYIAYITISIAFTIWVGRNLFKNGRVFLLEAFHNDEMKADSVNKLLLVGFYLVNIGIVSLFLSYGQVPDSDIKVFEYLSVKFGVVLIVLGFMHFYNMRNIAGMSARAKAKQQGNVA